MFEHEHPLNLIDLWLEQLQHDEEYGEDEEEEEEDDTSLIAKQEFRCLCFRCGEEINWFHRYYYTCYQCDYSIHKFCTELPERLQDIFHAHTLYLLQQNVSWRCDICRNHHKPDDIRYRCSKCDFDVDVNCATKRLQKNIIYHPSHIHPLFCLAKQILCECDACGKEHKGMFYHCTICCLCIYNDCAFQPKKLQIQHSTNGFFSHIHPLTLAYSFPKADQKSKFYPTCRVCNLEFLKEHLWIYKCEKCRYYTHLDCATSRSDSPPGRTTKNYEDAEHPDLIHLPFPDPSHSILKHLFSKESIYVKNTITPIISRRHHHHPLILGDAQYDDITSPTSSRIKSISFHDPIKNIQLLCDGCLRPIISKPIYVCANEDEDCNFVLHEWCSRLPTELKDHNSHPEHPLILHSKVSSKFFEVFVCHLCSLYCNGFAYCCSECNYYIDVNCAFLPKEITHTCHLNHLLSMVTTKWLYSCSMCGISIYTDYMFSCQICAFHLHTICALLIPEKATHKCDKHPMKLRYFPAENHKGDYFCEVCEEEFDPKWSFYHCDKCMQSMHTACAPSILRYETETYSAYSYAKNVYGYVNVMFGGTYNNIKVHRHPLSFIQGTASDGECDKCGYRLRYIMIFKCSNCKFAVHYNCCQRLIE
ncbi:hypothetical protein SSX86_025705 [Deinandra increscens subsp. villosa]|uniref:Phorbol-ester/DAG-type domain-containing protein n=1 Tax=Deinandra increscens subsp. villosa TaxID=3103831 RepID=A0AAP0CDI2_9ASTR